jgi:hypothetical protein
MMMMTLIARWLTEVSDGTLRCDAPSSSPDEAEAIRRWSGRGGFSSAGGVRFSVGGNGLSGLDGAGLRCKIVVLVRGRAGAVGLPGQGIQLLSTL